MRSALPGLQAAVARTPTHATTHATTHTTARRAARSVAATLLALACQAALASTPPGDAPDSISPGLGSLGDWWIAPWHWLLLAFQ